MSPSMVRKGHGTSLMVCHRPQQGQEGHTSSMSVGVVVGLPRTIASASPWSERACHEAQPGHWGTRDHTIGQQGHGMSLSTVAGEPRRGLMYRLQLLVPRLTLRLRHHVILFLCLFLCLAVCTTGLRLDRRLARGLVHNGSRHRVRECVVSGIYAIPGHSTNIPIESNVSRHCRMHVGAMLRVLGLGLGSN